MVITEEIKKRFQDCIETTIIFCTSTEQVKILGNLYNGTAFQNLNILSKDIELQFSNDHLYSYQDGYNFTYFKSRNEWKNWKTITFNQLMNVTNVYELW
jgi:hypothetical protein